MTSPAPAVTDAEWNLTASDESLRLVNAHRDVWKAIGEWRPGDALMPQASAVGASRALLARLAKLENEIATLRDERDLARMEHDATERAFQKACLVIQGIRTLKLQPGSRFDLDRMADAIHALPGAPVMGRAIGAGR